MSTASHHIVFVDDDPHEIGTFRRLFEARFRVSTVEARSPEAGLETAVATVGEAAVDLFVLDMYYPGGADAPTGFDAISARESAAQRLTLDALGAAATCLRDRFDADPADGKALLRQAHALVHRSRVVLDAWCAALDQSADGGIRLLQLLETRWPGVPKVFYSRKATLEDAKRCLAAGALDVLLKPDPSLEQEQARALAETFTEYCQGRSPAYLSR